LATLSEVSVPHPPGLHFVPSSSSISSLFLLFSLYSIFLLISCTSFYLYLFPPGQSYLESLSGVERLTREVENLDLEEMFMDSDDE
jgi:hypothetical protein